MHGVSFVCDSLNIFWTQLRCAHCYSVHAWKTGVENYLVRPVLVLAVCVSLIIPDHIVHTPPRIMETSKTLMEMWQNPESGPLPYASWTSARQKSAITKCGIAVSHHKGKRKQKEMLRHLSKSELPLDAGKVLQELKRRNICIFASHDRMTS